MQYYVNAKFFDIKNKGTAHEFRAIDPRGQESGPFSTRESAEIFARTLASQPGLARVEIDEREDEE